MRQTVVVLMSLLVCSLALAACGGSGSDSTSSTPTATSARLGNAPLKAVGCAAPTPAGVPVTFGAIIAVGTPCSTAQAGIVSMQKRGTVSGWTCTKREVGRNTSVQCTHNSDNGQGFSGSWYRS
jgi:hypothetical protein